jgi:D-serine dehydratase
MSSIQNKICNAQPVSWINPARDLGALDGNLQDLIGKERIQAAIDRFERFQPLLAQLFPNELSNSSGAIHSELTVVPRIQGALGFSLNDGDWFVKGDHSLPVAGSIKARGGFHEVLEFAEKVAIENQLLQLGEDYSKLLSQEAKTLFSSYEVAVGSTGNLGLSIGVMAAALGFQSVVHMSLDAKEWKKDRLRARGVKVIEHQGDYEQAVKVGREMAENNPLCHFVDDERSTSLFLGYAASAAELKTQLIEQGITVSKERPLCVYIPCGVGGAPAGIAWGLAQIFGDNVYCYFAEPVQSPCFLIQMLANSGENPSVYDYGLNNRTEADGLAVPRASLLAARAMKRVLAGSYTVLDQTLFDHLAFAYQNEGISIEPSAAAGFSGPVQLRIDGQYKSYATHIIWTTGGSLVPKEEFKKFLSRSTNVKL